jgi:hypothetical protein
MDDGFGSIETRLGAVEERRSGPGRAAEGCADMVGQFVRLLWQRRWCGKRVIRVVARFHAFCRDAKARDMHR